LSNNTAAKQEKIKQRMAVVSGLSAKQRTAVIQYLLHGGKIKAYIEAGYSEKYADSAASRFFKNPQIIEAIEEYFHQEEMSAAEAVAILSRQARGSMEDFLDINDGSLPLLDLNKAEDRDQLALIRKIKTRHTIRTTKDDEEIEDTAVEFELYDAQSAARDIARIHGKFGPTGSGDDPQNITIRVINDR
jgi:phage terminase small subunit